MTVFYSPSKDSCYLDDFRTEYTKTNSWPKDAVEITPQEYKVFFLDSPPEKRVRKYTKASGFSWVLVSETLTLEQQIAQERYWRDAELRRADIELNKAQDSDPKAFASVAEWREYRKALRQLPEVVGFPDKSVRPTAPDSV